MILMYSARGPDAPVGQEGIHRRDQGSFTGRGRLGFDGEHRLELTPSSRRTHMYAISTCSIDHKHHQLTHRPAMRIPMTTTIPRHSMTQLYLSPSSRAKRPRQLRSIRNTTRSTLLPLFALDIDLRRHITHSTDVRLAERFRPDGRGGRSGSFSVGEAVAAFFCLGQRGVQGRDRLPH